MRDIQFQSDKVKVKTGRVDNSAVVEFECGEHMLQYIAPLVSVRDRVLTITVQVEDE